MVELTTTGRLVRDARSVPSHVAARPTATPFAAPGIDSPSLLTVLRGTSASHQRFILNLQRTAGNAGLQRLLAPRPVVQRCGDTACDCSPEEQAAHAAEPALEERTVQRDPSPPGPFTKAREDFKAAIGEGPEGHKKLLADIQGYPMSGLLPALEKLPVEVRTDEEAARAVGGPRLVTATRAVAAKGQPWTDFLAGRSADLAPLPGDQIGDIMTYLGAPKDARYYKSSEFDGRFDGGVDPIGGVVTLYFRVKLDVAPVTIDGTHPGTAEWFKAAQKTREYIATKFAPDFKRVVEAAWSGKGTIKPACPYGAVKAFQTKVVVSVVDSDQNETFFIHPAGAEGRSNAGKEGFGNLKGDDNETKTRTDTVVDPTGKKQLTVHNTHITSAHEFGHAIGLDHSRCKGDDDSCYGVTAEERQDMMGAGDKLQVIKRGGKVLHDDFEPFERIGKRWGQDVLPANCNTWSAGT